MGGAREVIDIVYQHILGRNQSLGVDHIDLTGHVEGVFDRQPVFARKIQIALVMAGAAID
ncbi:MAG: hypothetical protein RI979_2009, partial [Pseudomonadota bacterium]